MRFGLALAFALVAGTAAADDFACRSLEGGEFPVTVNFKTSYSSGAYAVLGADFQIEGDIGYSTSANEPTSLATISGVEITPDEVLFRFHYKSAEYDGNVATIHVVTLAEGETSLTAGVFHAVGGGLYAISCEVDYEG